MMSGMSDRHCCWDGHRCPRPAVAAVVWRQGSEQRQHLQVCETHLLTVRMKAAFRGIHVHVDEGPDKARGGQ